VSFLQASIAPSKAVTIARKEKSDFPSSVCMGKFDFNLPFTLGSAKLIISGGNTSGMPPTFVLTTCNLNKSFYFKTFLVDLECGIPSKSYTRKKQLPQ